MKLKFNRTEKTLIEKILDYNTPPNLYKVNETTLLNNLIEINKIKDKGLVIKTEDNIYDYYQSLNPLGELREDELEGILRYLIGTNVKGFKLYIIPVYSRKGINNDYWGLRGFAVEIINKKEGDLMLAGVLNPFDFQLTFITNKFNTFKGFIYKPFYKFIKKLYKKRNTENITIDDLKEEIKILLDSNDVNPFFKKILIRYLDYEYVVKEHTKLEEYLDMYTYKSLYGETANTNKLEHSKSSKKVLEIKRMYNTLMYISVVESVKKLNPVFDNRDEFIKMLLNDDTKPKKLKPQLLYFENKFTSYKFVKAIYHKIKEQEKELMQRENEIKEKEKELERLQKELKEKDENCVTIDDIKDKIKNTYFTGIFKNNCGIKTYTQLKNSVLRMLDYIDTV